MCKIDFYLLPSDCYNNITIDDIFIFEKIINKIKLKDKFFVPKDFYEQTDKNTVSASNYLIHIQNCLQNTATKGFISVGEGMK